MQMNVNVSVHALALTDRDYRQRHLQHATPAVNQRPAADQTGTHRQVETPGAG